jgi:sulfur relay (sulfurtransferase) complex TusBCD TusD component (DsrE family)
MKLSVVITQSNAEQVFTALRFANFSRSKGDQVTVFLTAEGVEIVRLDDPRFDVKGQATSLVQQGGTILSCGSCMKLRDLAGSDICATSTMQGLYDLVVDSDKVVTF